MQHQCRFLLSNVYKGCSDDCTYAGILVVSCVYHSHYHGLIREEKYYKIIKVFYCSGKLGYRSGKETEVVLCVLKHMDTRLEPDV